MYLFCQINSETERCEQIVCKSFKNWDGLIVSIGNANRTADFMRLSEVRWKSHSLQRPQRLRANPQLASRNGKYKMRKEVIINIYGRQTLQFELLEHNNKFQNVRYICRVFHDIFILTALTRSARLRWTRR